MTEHSVHYLPLVSEGWDRAKRELHSQVSIVSPILASTRIRWWNYPGLAKRLQDRLRCIEPDVIHAGPIHLGATLTALTGFHPLVSMSWGSDLLWDTRNLSSAIAARYALANTDAFVGDCQAVKSAAIRYGMDKDRIVIFPWGVDLKHFSPNNNAELRRELGWENEFVLLSTRSFEPLYGVDLVVKAFIQLAPAFPSIRLLLLGDGSKRDLFENWLDQEGLLERVHLAGFVDRNRLAEYYRSADVYVSASRSDGSSVSLMEALACGVPALVSDIPGNCEWVEPGVNGWRFLDGNIDSLITTLRTLLEEKDSLARLGEAARTIAEKRANWDLNFPKLLEAYQVAMDHAAI